MNIFEQINILLIGEKPFVCYAKPNETIGNLLIQNNSELNEFSGQSGFVFMPFDAGLKVVLPFEGNSFQTEEFVVSQKESSKAFKPSEIAEKLAFEALVSKGIVEINKGIFQKVVVSRKIVLNENLAILDTFQNLIATYQTAFRYLFFHPKIGLWMGATPEQLVKINHNNFETVALAGTQLYSESVTWATKEIEEQQFVTDYIVAKVKDKVNKLIISNAKTVKAGNLAHLKSFISGELTTDFQLIDLIKILHPTPAVCGLPKENAIDFILKSEGYNRKYYAGFLGEYNKDNQTDLFVNLRCLEVDNDVVNIYVGCGITKDSNPEKEFIETENKSMTMRNILVVNA
ncbi:isochorismate synthase [Flavobacterium psychraquaticum]|uniref:isochorismate synthase n=1 Tax=Flavobacterium psychraquaticum TaxID=3103958 RepID=UPI002ACDFA83|nr:isochorismate synthase [Flavobacterium sp. LB-N7T]